MIVVAAADGDGVGDSSAGAFDVGDKDDEGDDDAANDGKGEDDDEPDDRHDI